MRERRKKKENVEESGRKRKMAGHAEEMAIFEKRREVLE
jgi:hypothetical protein